MLLDPQEAWLYRSGSATDYHEGTHIKLATLHPTHSIVKVHAMIEFNDGRFPPSQRGAPLAVYTICIVFMLGLQPPLL